MGTFNTNILPSATGLNLGSDDQQWDAYIKDLVVGGTLTSANIANVRIATVFTGADIGAQVNAAFADLGGAYGTVYVPAGTYTYTNDIYFSAPAALVLDPGAVLNYTGTGKAVKFGPDGLTSTTYSPHPYILKGGRFTGGGSMAYGIYFNNYLVKCLVYDTEFYNFGGASKWNIWFNAANWDIRLNRVYMWRTSLPNTVMNGVYINAGEGGTSDFGQSQITVTNCHFQNLGTLAGTGIYLNGFNSIVADNTIAGFQPNIQVGAWAGSSVIECNRMESAAGSAPCISYGDSSGSSRVSNYIDHLVVRDNYCNVHNTDFGTTVHFIGPTTANTGLQYAVIENNRTSSYTSGQPLVVLNAANSSQIGNVANWNLGNSGTNTPCDTLRTTGGLTSVWNGTDETLTLNHSGLAVKGVVSGTDVATFTSGANTTAAIGVYGGTNTSETGALNVYDYNGSSIAGGLEAIYTGRVTVKGKDNVVVMQGDSAGVAYFGPSQNANINASGKGTFKGGLDANNAGIANAGAIAGASSVTIGGGTAVTKIVVYTPSLTPASVNGDLVAEQTFTVSGLTTADKVIVNPPAITNATGIAGARVSAADTLAIRFVNPTAGALTPDAGTYTVIAFRS